MIHALDLNFEHLRLSTHGPIPSLLPSYCIHPFVAWVLSSISPPPSSLTTTRINVIRDVQINIIARLKKLSTTSKSSVWITNACSIIIA